MTMEGSFDFLNRGMHLTANCSVSLNLESRREADEVRSSYMDCSHVCEVYTRRQPASDWNILVNRPELLFEVLNVILIISPAASRSC